MTMKKLTLTLDALAVESFAATPANETRGTVAGYDVTDVSCVETCINSCGGTCKYNTCNAPWQCP
jgi:hypothetical protein